MKPAAGKITRKPGLRIGYVPQKLQIDATLPLTVRRFVNLPRRQTPDAIRAALTTAGVPDLAERQMVDLSGGQFQRVLHQVDDIGKLFSVAAPTGEILQILDNGCHFFAFLIGMR